MIRPSLLLVLLLLLPPLGRAEPSEIASSLTLEPLVSQALAENPQLRAVRSKWEAMRERPGQQQSLPNPMFKYGAMDPTKRSNYADADEKRFMIEQEVPGFGKRALRGKVAGKEAEAMQREYETMQREIVMLVKENYYDLYGVQRSQSITRTEEDVLKRLESITETKYATGTVSQQDVLKAQTEITMLRQKLYDLEQQETTLKAKLNELLNRRVDAPLGLTVTPPVHGFDLDLEKLFATAEHHRAEIQQAQAQIERQQTERDLMKKEFWPDYRLGIEYRNFRAGDDLLMLTVGFDLPIWQGKYRSGVREAEKMIESSQAAREATERQITFDVRDAQFKLLTARRTLELYQAALIPQAQARFEASEAGYRTGKVDFLDLLESERFLLNARVMAAMAEGNLGMQLARLERAIGTDLPKAEEKI